MRNIKTPVYWKSRLSDVEDMIKAVKKGRARELCLSAGGRSIYLAEYGQKNRLERMANFSSACGAGDLTCYADKSYSGYRPAVFLVGGIHGAEFEGTVALLNLIRVMESGMDLAGEDRKTLREAAKQLNLVIIPSVNPDGRGRVPFDSMAGKSQEELRYYNQGTWADGSLAGWPGCKKRHPMRGNVGYLGGYYNDDGINLMHDNFFMPMAGETAALLQAADEYAPDFMVLLHGGANCVNTIMKTAYAPEYITNEIDAFERRLKEACGQAGLCYREGPARGAAGFPPPSFNLCSAITHLCGAACITYETNQGLGFGAHICTHDEIYSHHLLLFEELFKFCLQKGGGR